jgi:hypothetical protein
VVLKDKLWAAASPYIEGKFTTHMDELKGMNKDAHEYILEQI